MPVSPEYPKSKVGKGQLQGQHLIFPVDCAKGGPCVNGPAIGGNLGKVPEGFTRRRFNSCQVCENANTSASVTKILPDS